MDHRCANPWWRKRPKMNIFNYYGSPSACLPSKHSSSHYPHYRGWGGLELILADTWSCEAGWMDGRVRNQRKSAGCHHSVRFPNSALLFWSWSCVMKSKSFGILLTPCQLFPFTHLRLALWHGWAERWHRCKKVLQWTARKGADDIYFHVTKFDIWLNCISGSLPWHSDENSPTSTSSVIKTNGGTRVYKGNVGYEKRCIFIS